VISSTWLLIDNKGDEEMLKEHKYLVCAIYRDQPSISQFTRIDYVGIVLAYSPFDAVKVAKRGHNPGEEKPRKYVASLILGPFRINAFSDRTYTCEELLSIRKG